MSDQPAPASEPAPSPSGLLADVDLYAPAKPNGRDPAPQPAAASQGEPEPEEPGEPGDGGEPVPEPAEPGAEPEGEVEEIEVSSLQQLAEHYEIDPAFLDGLAVTVKVNGETSEVPLKDVIDSYRTQEAAKKRLEEAKVKSGEMEERLRLRELDVDMDIIERRLTAQAKLIDDEATELRKGKLRTEDPAEFSAKMEELRERREAIGKARETARANYDKAAADIQKTLAEHAETSKAAEREKLLEAIPEWRDPAVEKAEWGGVVVPYLTGLGFDKADIENTHDHRLKILARDAARGARSKDKLAAAKKKVLKVPKVVKPGARSDAKPAPGKAPEGDRAGILYG